MAKANGKRSSSEPKDWQDGTAKARAVRANVAEQVAELIVERDMTGAEGLVATRIRQVADAQRRGDRVALRAAIMELSVSSAHWVAAIDLQQQVRSAA
ncbi:MAG TPA: hypothetical protein VF192_00980 [Longimicrobiales bacterium]